MTTVYEQSKISTRYLVGESFVLPYSKEIENMEPNARDAWGVKWLKDNRIKPRYVTNVGMKWQDNQIVGIRIENFDYTKEAC